MSDEDFKCTQCQGSAFIAYSASKKSDWDGKIKKGERLCLKCGAERVGFNFFASLPTKGNA